MDAISQKQIQYNVTIPSQYVHLHPGEEKPLLVFIHGYADSGSSFLRRILPSPDSRFEILAPNGLFPLPQRVENEWKEAYAWFFADLAANRIIVPPVVSAKAMSQLIEGLGLSERRKILCGFSQGGYFLPHLARELKNVERMIAIGSGFRPADFERFKLRLPVAAIHGDADDVIPMKRSRDEFEKLGEWNTGGEFSVIPGMTHTVDEAGRSKFQALLGERPA